MSKTRQEKIEAMLETVQDWDIDSLVTYVQGTLEENFKMMSDDMIDQEYIDFTGDEAYLEDDEDVSYEPTEEKCTCGRMKDIGHKCWWCGN